MSQSVDDKQSGYYKIILLLITLGTAVYLISPVSADTGVTIAAQGDQSYYLGENVVLSGHNYDSDSAYLFITGPDTSNGGGKLTSPHQNVVSGNPDSFTIVKTKPDKTWEYNFYTYNLNVSPGTYTIYAVSQPKTKDQLGPSAGNVQINLKRPFITAGISPSSVTKGQPFTITGSTEGQPSAVQIWIIGDNYLFTTTNPVNPDSSFNFDADAKFSEKLPKGQNYLIVQHPMMNNVFDIVVSGDYVRNLKINNGTNIFRITGPGSLQGNDAAEALIAAFNDPTANEDTFTEIPFLVGDTGSSTPQPPAATTTTPVQHPTRTSPLQFAPLGALVLILGIAVWSRH